MSSRKQALQRRAQQYADANNDVGAGLAGNGDRANAYERGYRDAIKDIRKIKKAAEVSLGTGHHEIAKFLQPMR